MSGTDTPVFSIIIPTNRDAARLAPCLTGLAQQQAASPPFEVIVAANGRGAPPAWPKSHWPFPVTVVSSDPENTAAARNRGAALARGRFVLFLNDDVVPEPELLAAHLHAHKHLRRPALVVGEAEWARYADETVFDCMVRCTSMIFFYHRMLPHCWYNFRHAWTLNLSVEHSYLQQVPFDERIRPVNYEDLEWAYRLEHGPGLRVWFVPQARVRHDHRYTLQQYLDREAQLGGMAALLWQANPACYREIFGGPLDNTFVDYCRRFVATEGRSEDDMRRRLQALIGRPLEEFSSEAQMQQELAESLYLAHLPLKRLAFRRGLLASAEAGGLCARADSSFVAETTPAQQSPSRQTAPAASIAAASVHASPGT